MRALSAAVLVLSALPVWAAPLPQLRVSGNKRFFVQSGGAPFFYLGDTAWNLFGLKPDDIDYYLKDRAAKRFNVIQAVIAHGLKTRDAQGEGVFLDGDPARPNEAYFKTVDRAIEQAESLGLYFALLPIWAQHNIHLGERVVLDKSTAFGYGRFLGRRYRDKAILWVLGGDWVPDGVEEVWRAMAAGLAEGDGGAHLKTFHPTSIHSSSQWFHNDAWLDFNMIQSRHLVLNRGYDLVAEDYARSPVKPVLDGESGYEGIFDNLAMANPPKRIEPHDVRRYAYTSVFAGAAGYTYGATEVFMFWNPGRGQGYAGSAQLPWKEALQRPGASQMQHLRSLIESRPMLVRIPDQWMIVNDPNGTTNRIQACRASDGSYAFLYTASGRPIEARVKEKYYEAVTGGTIRAWWYDPRTGTPTRIGDFEKKPRHKADEVRTEVTREFIPPSSGEGNDWVLVLDDASRSFPPPGTKRP
jgi:hypothetical protein